MTERLFARIAEHLPSDEDAFTAFLATAANEIPALGKVLLRWLQDESQWNLGAEKDWRFKGQDKLPGRSIDMVARCDAISAEIWFEHKLESAEGLRGEEGQVEKYFQLAKTFVEPHHPRGVSRVFIAYVARDDEGVRAWERMEAGDHAVRLLNRQGRSFRWRDLYPRIERMARDDAGGMNEEQRWLLAELVDFWKSLRGMAPSAKATAWSPPRSQVMDSERAGLNEAWEDTRRGLVSLLGGAVGSADLGLGVYIRNLDKAPRVSQIHLARTNAAEDRRFPQPLRGEFRNAALVRIEVTMAEGVASLPPESVPEGVVLASDDLPGVAVAFAVVSNDAHSFSSVLPREVGKAIAQHVVPAVGWMVETVETVR